MSAGSSQKQQKDRDRQHIDSPPHALVRVHPLAYPSLVLARVTLEMF